MLACIVFERMIMHLAVLLLPTFVVSHTCAFNNSVQQCGGVIVGFEKLFIRRWLAHREPPRSAEEHRGFFELSVFSVALCDLQASK